MAKTPQIQSIGLSWREFRPAASKSANCNLLLQSPSSCLRIAEWRSNQSRSLSKSQQQSGCVPILMDIVTILKALTEARHHVHLGEVKAQAGVKGTFLPMLPPSRVVTQRSIDAGGNLNDIPNEDLEVARIDSNPKAEFSALDPLQMQPMQIAQDPNCSDSQQAW